MLDDKSILLKAKRRYEECTVQWGDIHEKSTELFQFIAGEQWTYQARQTYENAGFAAMTSNRLPGYLRQITNELIKNTPEIQVDPHDDQEEQKAQVLNDLMRSIQEHSKAKVAYCKGAEHAASVGIGYWRVLTKFKDKKSFDKILCIEKIDDPNTVMLDPHHVGLAGEDSDYAFLTIAMSKDEYKLRFPNTRMTRALTGTESEEDLAFFKDVSWTEGGRKWTDVQSIIVLEYYFKDYKQEKLYLVHDKQQNMTFTTKTLDKFQLDSGFQEVLDKRIIDVPVIRWCKLNDLEVLEQTEWPGEYIPIVAVKADEYWIEGKRKLVGAVEPAVEAQVELNYAKSWRGQLLQSSPKAPYIGTVGQFKNFEQQWANMNVSNQTFLPYNMDGNAPPPSRDLGEIPIQAATLLAEKADQDMRAIFGTFDPDQKNDAVESGKAILARQDQSYNSNYHIFANVRHSIAHTGCILLQAIPVVYDTARTESVLAEDGKKRTVSLNTPNEQGVVEYDMREGEYTVSIQSGPSFGTKRQEMAEAVMDLIGAYPESAPAIADLAVRQMDWAGAQQIADSLEAMVPPQVLAARKTDPKNAAALVPSLQAQLAAAKTQIQQLTAEHQEMVAKVNDKTTDLQIEIMKSKDDQHKVDSDTAYKMAQLKQQEQISTLEFLIREKELQLTMLELKLKEREMVAKTTIAAVDVMHDMNKTHHDVTVDHLDRGMPDVPGTMDEGGTPGLGDALE